MPKQHVENLISELHDLFGTEEPSAQQQKLLQQLSNHIHETGEEDPADLTPLESVELMLEQMGEEHPRTSAVLKEIMTSLKNMGV